MPRFDPAPKIQIKVMNQRERILTISLNRARAGSCIFTSVPARLKTPRKAMKAHP
ncbi:MAG: hypothetical protein A4E61_00945 [Syntrophorhabdus sp. PtaB.Bin184]|nr:MAG: hypothetical protein A4E61_00945 [Syntrophorhabdus sp. PtaB.Bin184]